MTSFLIDSNVILDVATADPRWATWATEVLERCSGNGHLIINPIVFAEVSIGFERLEDLEAAMSPADFQRHPLPWEAAFLAGKCFVSYRRRGGQRTAPLPDFYIGAHAAVAGFTLVTRDVARYRTYFPSLPIICP